MSNPPKKTVQPLSVLVVDDNLLIRSMIESSLKSANYEVVCAGNGNEALHILQKRFFPIVMTDWVMPGMDGLELCRQIRRKAADNYTFIILLTAQKSPNDIVAGLEAGADEYLVKPVNHAELLARLKTARRILDLEDRLKKSVEEIRSLSLVDPVTGVYSRRFMEERIPQEIKRTYRYERSMSLLLVGIDRFPELVGSYGKFLGDLVLKECGASLTESMRGDIDWLARYGDDQFVVVLPETEASGAMVLAQRLRLRFSATVIKYEEKEFRVTASVGVVSFTVAKEREGITARMILDKAGRCLELARDEGGNTIKGVQFSS